MGYFANATEGEFFANEFCNKCVFYTGCPVYKLHLLYGYELCNSKNIGKEMLDTLIEILPDGNQKCAMFYEER